METLHTSAADDLNLLKSTTTSEVGLVGWGMIIGSPQFGDDLPQGCIQRHKAGYSTLSPGWVLVRTEAQHSLQAPTIARRWRLDSEFASYLLG